MSKVAIVTAAGRGIGAGIARKLSADGYKLGLLSPGEGVVKLAAELGGIAIRGSVTEPADIKRLVDETTQKFGRLDAAVINAGHPPKGQLLALTDADWHAGLDMAVLSVVRVSRLVTPIMQAQKSGSIVALSSYAAFEPEGDFPMTTLRAALGAYVKLYADTYARDGIRMNAVLARLHRQLAGESGSARPHSGRPLRHHGRDRERRRVPAVGCGKLRLGQNIRVDGGVTKGV